MLRLPAMLRIHSRHGRNQTSFTPAPHASNAAKIATSPARNTATVCQSHSGADCGSAGRVRTLASTAIRLNENVPHSIHTYGRASGWVILKPYRSRPSARRRVEIPALNQPRYNPIAQNFAEGASNV